MLNFNDQPRFQPARGGHAPGVLRKAFNEALDLYIRNGGNPTVELRRRRVSLFDLCGLLWNCNDTMPRFTCDDVPKLLRGVEADRWSTGHSYAQGARRVRRALREDFREEESCFDELAEALSRFSDAEIERLSGHY